MSHVKITESNFDSLAMRIYDNPQCTSVEEFVDDLKRFSYLKKLFGRYVEKGDLKERLILNHLIIIFNVFGIAATEFLFFKIDREYWPILATFLDYMDMLCDVPEFGIDANALSLDPIIAKALESI